MSSIAEQLTLACILEASARKVGNVHPGESFPDLDFLDLAAAAVLAGPILARVTPATIGETILTAQAACQQAIRSNANLGIILLLAPLAALGDAPITPTNIQAVLTGIDLPQTALTFAAIAATNPGGLGVDSEHDVRQPPTESLLAAMRRAADRDAIARQYATNYVDVLGLGLDSLNAALQAHCGLEDAIVWCQLQLLASFPDSLIRRKVGAELAAQSAGRSQQALAVFDQPRPGLTDADCVQAVDAWHRDPHHQRNPGATADLIAAILFVALRRGLIDARCRWRSDQRD